jgi:hypothetical protein
MSSLDTAPLPLFISLQASLPPRRSAPSCPRGVAGPSSFKVGEFLGKLPAQLIAVLMTEGSVVLSLYPWRGRATNDARGFVRDARRRLRFKFAMRSPPTRSMSRTGRRKRPVAERSAEFRLQEVGEFALKLGRPFRHRQAHVRAMEVVLGRDLDAVPYHPSNERITARPDFDCAFACCHVSLPCT